MSVTYDFDFALFTALDASLPYPNASTLPQEIIDAGLTGLESVLVEDSEDEVYIQFSGALSGGDQTILASVVSAHTGLDESSQGLPAPGSTQFRSIDSVVFAQLEAQYNDQDVMYIQELDKMFQMNLSSGAAPNGTTVIKPTLEAGDARWVCIIDRNVFHHFLLRPGVPDDKENGIYAVWDELYAVILTIPVGAVIQIDDAAGETAIDGSMAPYDLSGLTFTGKSFHRLFVRKALSGMPSKMEGGVFMLNDQPTVAFTATSLIVMTMNSAGVMSRVASGPLLKFAGGVGASFLCDNAAFFNDFPDVGGPSIEIESPSFVNFQLGQNSAVSPNQLKGTGQANMGIQSTSVFAPDSHPSHSGTFNRILATNSNQSSYSNASSGLNNAGHVQDALDELLTYTEAKASNLVTRAGTSYADVPNMVVTPGKIGKYLVTFSGTVSRSGSTIDGMFQFAVGAVGARVAVTDSERTERPVTSPKIISMQAIVEVTDVAHGIALQWKGPDLSNFLQFTGRNIIAKRIG